LLNKQDIEFFKEFINLNEINKIDLRYVNNLGYWSCVSYNIKELDNLACLSNIKIDENIILIDLSKDRYFIDPFLPHKTLVFLINKDTYDVKHNENIILDYYLNDKILDENYGDKYNYLYLSKPFDRGSDIRNEIVSSLECLGVNVLSHYHNNKANGHILVIKNANNDVINCDNIQKVKYAILMICNAYNVQLDIKSGVFIKYNTLA
jgi:glutamine synthetase